MADVTKIPGPVPNEPNRESREVKPGTDKFKDLMKIDKSGEREKKKKKRQQETEEDNKADLRTGSATPDKVSDTKKAEQFQKIQKVGESEKRQSMAQKRAEESAVTDEAAAAQINQKKIEDINLDQVESATLKKNASAPPSYAGQIDQKEVVEEKIEAVEKEEQEETLTIRRQVKKDNAAPSSLAATSASTTLGPLFIAPAPLTAPAYTLLNGQMLELFEKMISQIFIMQANGINETTIHLNTPEFASSMFSGAQIIIKEYSTAPLAFNIEFLGSPQNSLFFEQNIASLRAAFSSEDRKYSINRIESRLFQKSEKPLFHRKEKTSNKDKEDSQ
jgi:hypothetical protein